MTSPPGLPSMPEILGSTLYATIAAAVLIHGITKYMVGPTPDIRREGMDEIMDVVVGSAMLAVLYALLLAPGTTFLPWLVHEVAGAVPIGNTTLVAYLPQNTTDPRSLLSWAYETAYRYFSAFTGWYTTFWGTVLVLSAIPQTAPLGWYAQQATWYLQMMMTYTIVNLGLIYALNLIAYNSWWLLPLGVGLVIVRQTRSIGTFIIAFLTVVSILGPLLAAYTVAALQGPIHGLDAAINPQGVNNILNDLKDLPGILTTLLNQGYGPGLSMQTYDVTVDVALAMALAASYGLYRILDETIIDVLPI